MKNESEEIQDEKEIIITIMCGNVCIIIIDSLWKR